MLSESLLRAVSFKPRSLKFPNAWVGHLPFAAWLTQELAPRTFVELGTHSGNSFFAFCQAVADADLPTRCYAVDTWKGDEHADHYSEAVFEEVRRHHHQHYAAFARLLRTTFDEAVTYFDDASVDLIHIDGLHTYDAVRYDFETWLPKLSPGAVVLFHDTNVRERNFGVWRFWLELERAYPRHLEFVHSHGLGVLQLNNVLPGKELPWLVPGSPEQATVLRFFAAMSTWHLDHYDQFELADQAGQLNRQAADLRAQLADVSAVAAGRDQKLGEMHQGIVYREGELARRADEIQRLSREIADLRQTLATFDELRRSRVWRLAAPPGRMAIRALRRLRDHTRPTGAAPVPVDVSAILDADWYLAHNPDVRSAGVAPVAHFSASGWHEGRQPHPLFDTRWYLDTYPDVRAAGVNPLEHFVALGWREGRNPHPLFETRWYLDTYPDVRAAGVNPLEHYLRNGAAELRNPNPGFDANAYVARHPEARSNPLRHYVEHGPETPTVVAASPEPAAEPRTSDVRDYLPRGPIAADRPQVDVTVDVIVPVYKGYTETRRCIESILADPERLPGVIRVIDDCSPDGELSAWLTELATAGRIELTRNTTNRGFVASVNLGMARAAAHDVVLLNSDTELPPGALRRLAGHAYATPKVGTVTPLSNFAGEMCSYPSDTGGPLPEGFTTLQIDAACRAANDQQAVEVPVGRGFCLYIRRRCLDDVGAFDEEAFGRGYGEESDFCLRAGQAGWRNLLACDTFVYHAGQVSFGSVAPERDQSWHTLVARHPDLPARLRRHVASAPTRPLAFAATAALFRDSDRPTVLVVAHNLDDRAHASFDDSVSRAHGTNLLRLSWSSAGLDLSVPSLPGHPIMRLPADGLGAAMVYARACGVDQVEVQHWVGLGPELRLFLQQIGTPVAMTVHDYAMSG